MSYARIVNNVITEFGLPNSARRLDTNEWVMGLNESFCPESLRAACGFFVIDESAIQPPNTTTTFFLATYEVNTGRPVLVWVETPKEPEQITKESREFNLEGLLLQARNAIIDNNAFLADNNVNNAEAVAQIQRLTQQNNRIIRVIVGSDLLD